MRTRRPTLALVLTDEEYDWLQTLAHRAHSQPLLARRARVVLACAEGLDDKTVARKMGASPQIDLAMFCLPIKVVDTAQRNLFTR